MSISTKEQLVNDGKIEFGFFQEPIENVNLIDARISSLVKIPKFLKNLRLKEFQAFQGGDENYFYNIALFNAKLMGFAQIRILDIKNKKQYLYEKQVNPLQLRIPNNILNSTNAYKSKDFSVHIENRLRDEYIKISFSAKGEKGLPDVEGSITGDFKNCDHMVVSVPFAENRGMYAHKSIIPMSGFLNLGSDRHRFEKDQSFFMTDDHKGFYPYVMKWDWITAAFVKNGKVYGLNLTKNQSIDNERHNENGVWIDGKLHRLPGIHFYRSDNVWRIKDQNDRIHLTFQPMYPNVVKINLGPLGKSDYEGPFGTVSGTVKLDNGEVVSFKKVCAFAEKQYIRV
ncbi:MAG: DUF2804 domain-containing protein [Aureispira sp.]|nr:DUF2804 domain-containing protein [Aureispira sp.]